MKDSKQRYQEIRRSRMERFAQSEYAHENDADDVAPSDQPVDRDNRYRAFMRKQKKKGLPLYLLLIASVLCGIATFILLRQCPLPAIITIAVLYAASWVVAIVALIQIFSEEKSSGIPLLLVIVAGAAFLIAGPYFVIPVTLIAVFGHLKDKRDRIHQRDQKMREASRIRQLVDHIKLGYHKDTTLTQRFISTYRHLEMATKEEQYGRILGCLNKVNLPAPYTMWVKFAERSGLGDESKLYVTNDNGVRHFDIFNYVDVEDSPEGAWQSFLLSDVWRLLPLFWHALYGVRTYLFTKDEFVSFAKQKHIPDGDIEQVVSKIDESNVALDPIVIEEGGHYAVSCCYWNDWAGLCREYVTVTIADGKATVGEAFSTDVLYKYHCGMFY